MNPRPYQLTAVENAVAAVRDGGRAQVIMACGTGKTEVARWIADALSPIRMVYLAPSIALVAQPQRRWQDKMGWRGRCLSVCSDSTARGRDEIRIADAGIPAVTTDPEEIARFLSSPEPCVVFGTYQSSAVVAEAVRAVGGVDLVICDEAHHLAGRSDAAFSCALDDAEMPASRRIFMTATPRVYSSKNDDAVSMDDHAVFGEVVYRYNFGDAIRDGRLADYDVVIFAVDDRHALDLLSRDDASDVASVFGVAKAISRFGLQRGLSFHSRVSRARAFAENIQIAASKSGMGIVARHVSGQMSAKHRRSVLSLLDGEGVVISNARCLGEGVDLPAVDFVAFVDPRSSHIDIVQAVGRAMRPHMGKRRATILIPVYVGPSESAEDVIRSSRYKHVGSVLRAIREHDERFESKLGGAARPLSSAEHDEDGPGVIFDLPEWLLSAIEPTLLRDSSPDPWRDMFEDVKRAWPTLTRAQNRWCNAQNRAHKGRGGYVSTPERRALLESLEGWTWNDPWSDRFNKTFEEVKAAWPTLTRRLQGWCNGQRRARRGKGRYVSTPERRALLETLEGWKWEPDQWRDMFEEVKAAWPILTRKQRNWCDNNRAAWRGKGSCVSTPERRALLESLERWKWEPDSWSDMFEEVKAAWPTMTRRLQIWCNIQRYARKGKGKTKSTPERRALLESLEGWTW